MKPFFVKYRTTLIVAAVVLAIGVAYWYVAANHAPSFNTVTAARGNVVQSLDESGSVLTENSAMLSFQTAGQITSLNVREGNTVAAGTVLASLDTSALNAAVSQANAAVAVAQANLDQLESGTRPEQLAIEETSVVNASASLGVAVGSAYAAADDAIQNQTDNLFTNPNTNNPAFLIPIANSQTVINIQNNRVAIGVSLAAWYAAANVSSSNQTALAPIAEQSLQQIASYLNTIALAVNGATPNAGVSAAALAGFKVNVVTARAEINGAITAITAAEAVLQSTQGQLALAQAGATPQNIEAQKAAVQQAQAAASSAQVALQHAELVAPFGGTVENLAAVIGQVVSPGAPMLSLINNSGLKVRTYVSEADVAKIKAGDAASVTLDAFGTGTVFPATITTVSSAETSVNGTPAYEVELHFANPDSRIKDGMTGNVHIVLGEHDNVIAVPSRLVINDGNNYFVLVSRGGESIKQQVEIGLTGDAGMTEITSGVNVGDLLTNF